jgi:hypothetical protein
MIKQNYDSFVLEVELRIAFLLKYRFFLCPRYSLCVCNVLYAYSVPYVNYVVAMFYVFAFKETNHSQFYPQIISLCKSIKVYHSQ